jgi:hypothetical protein
VPAKRASARELLVVPVPFAGCRVSSLCRPSKKLACVATMLVVGKTFGSKAGRKLCGKVLKCATGAFVAARLFALACRCEVTGFRPPFQLRCFRCSTEPASCGTAPRRLGGDVI